MSRIQKFERKWGANAAEVLSSIAQVARAGRSGDKALIDEQRARHYGLMARIRQSNKSP